MKVIVVGNLKGGVGKSTVSCNLGVAGVLDGKKVLIIDSDPQGSSMTFRAVRQCDKLKAVSITQPTIHKDIYDFSNFDLVIVDAGGRDSALFRSAVIAASGGILLIPILPSQYDIWATEDTFAILRESRVYKEIKAYAMFNQVMQNTTTAQEALATLQEMTEENEVTLLNSKLISRIDYKKSISEGKGVMEFAPNGKAALEIKMLYNEIMESFSTKEGKRHDHEAKTKV